MSLSNIHFDLKELLKEALEKKDYNKVMSILERFFSPLNNENIDAILFKDVKTIVKTKEDLENILLSTKVAFEKKEEIIEFFKMLIDYGFKENAFDYFEHFISEVNDLEIIDGLSSILKE